MREFVVTYYAPCQVLEMNAQKEEEDQGKSEDIQPHDDATARRLHYKVDVEWRPELEVREGLRYAGSERYGGEVIEKFTKRRNWLG